MVQSPSSEANWFAASQEIPRISRNPKVHYRTHKRPPPVFYCHYQVKLKLFNSSINEISVRNKEQVSFACVTLSHFVQKTQIHTALFRSLTALSSIEIRYIHTRFWCRNIKEWKKLEDLGLNGSMKLKQTMLIQIQPDATVCRYLFTAKSLFMFRVSQHPSSGVLKTVTVTSGTGHNIGTATSLQRCLIGTGFCESCGRYWYRRLRLQFLVLLMMGAVTPEPCRVSLQWINICILLHLVGFLLTLNCDARNLS